MRARRTTLPVLVGAGAAALLLSGCGVGSLGVHGGTSAQESTASIHLTPASSAPIAPTTPLVVTAVSGRLTGVVVTGPSGPVPGELSVDGSTWTATGGILDYGAKYKIAAHAVDLTGLRTDLTRTVRTIAPSKFLSWQMSPSPGSTVGVGMPIRVSLDHQLTTTEAKAAFERAATVTADGVAVSGGWRWLTDDVALYRPQRYWPGHATITLTTALKGVKFSKGLWGQASTSTSFTTGPAMVSYVDMLTDEMTVTRDGKKIRTIPITTGKPGFETRSGVKVIMDKELTRVMDAATGGTAKTDPEYYRIEVQYAMRLTYSGEFLHAAPWSVRSQGHANVSHGCTGMSTSNAAWLYDHSNIGDVVIYTGTNRAMESGNGITVWNTSWSTWKTYSALNA
ncbi:MAG: L,D-transpeptidase family protein [Frankiales bacterium]|nr:L,D-transpeptidase family protein [Frankiales bacterium]